MTSDDHLVQVTYSVKVPDLLRQGHLKQAAYDHVSKEGTSHPLWAQSPSQSEMLPCVHMDHPVFQLVPIASGLLTGHK